MVRSKPASRRRRTEEADAVARTRTAKEYVAGHRLFGLVESDLLWAFDVAAMGLELQPHLWGRLVRRPPAAG